MSEEPSFEQLSVSSNDSWALLDVDETAGDLCIIDRPDKEFCFICNQPLTAVRFPCPTCDVCLICSSCKEAYDLQRLPACCHTVHPDAEIPMFYFDDSAGEDILIMNPQNRSPFEEVHAVSCLLEPDNLISSSELIQSSVTTPDSHIADSKQPTENKSSPHLRDLEYRSLTDQVREALNLHASETDVCDTSVGEENPLEAQTVIFGGPHPMDQDQLKLILSPNLWSKSESVGSNGSIASNNSSIPVPKMSVLPVLRNTIQVVRSTCSSSECQTSSSSSCSRSPPSLSSSPANRASKILKSVAIHSASAMNHFDCMPMDALDSGTIATSRTETKSSPEYQPSTPPSYISAVLDDRRTSARDFVTRFVWDHEKMNSLIKPRPIPKSVVDQSAYNLR